MPPVVIGAGIAAAGAVGASVISSNSAKSAANKASKTAADTAAANNALQREIYDRNEQRLGFYDDQIGRPAATQINALLGLAGANDGRAAFDTFRDSTGYQFGLNEGMRSLNSLYAGRGALDSGAGMKAALKFGNDYATQQGFYPYLNALQGQQGLGLSSASALAGVSQNYGNQVAANNNAAGSAAANAALVSGTASGQAMGGIANALGQFGSTVASSFGGGSVGGFANGLPPYNPTINNYTPQFGFRNVA